MTPTITFRTALRRATRISILWRHPNHDLIWLDTTRAAVARSELCDTLPDAAPSHVNDDGSIDWSTADESWSLNGSVLTIGC